jgi:quinol monooxygenase YgiN
MILPLLAGIAPIPLLASALLAAAAPSVQDENPLLAQIRREVSDPSKPFVMLIHVKAKAGEGAKVREAFAPAVAATLKEKGCLDYALSASATDPDTFILYERWASISDLEAHLSAAHTRALLAALGPVTTAAPALELFVPVSR